MKRLAAAALALGLAAALPVATSAPASAAPNTAALVTNSMTLGAPAVFTPPNVAKGAIVTKALVIVWYGYHYLDAYGCRSRAQWVSTQSVRITALSVKGTCQYISVKAYGSPKKPPCYDPCTITIASGRTGPQVVQWWPTQLQSATSTVKASDFYASSAYLKVASNGGLVNDLYCWAAGDCF